ncbi:GntR family transcriptional regulator [Streptomyces sp. CA-181903]|uniref:GntR family transcriptional regulator n=1 Tax=Streptomyces sp. CA-181903 TaxID=3240055 RepID=UPI003D8CD9E3
MGSIQRPGALYQQVAAEIRNAISAGEFPPGAPLPSETQLIERYKVSRPTVRNAIAALRSEGLIEVVHGKGSFVRPTPVPALTIHRTITRHDSATYVLGHRWETAEPPQVYRTETTAATGPLLELGEGEALVVADRILADPSAGTRALHRTLIPESVIKGTPLADMPDADPEKVYAELAAAGRDLTWTETVSARMPQPEERAALGISEATPVLRTVRVTYDGTARPIAAEELLVDAALAQVAFRITAAEDAPAPS